MSEKGIFQIVLKFLLGSGINHKLQEDNFQINSRKNENTFHTAVKSCGVPISFNKSNEGFDYYSRIYSRIRGIRAIIFVVAGRKLIHCGASDVPYTVSILGFSQQFCVACVRYR